MAPATRVPASPGSNDVLAFVSVDAAAMARRASLRVLIVDDHRAFREVARGLLEYRGYTVVGEAGDAIEAVDATARLQPDAVLLDVRLGEHDGFAIAPTLARACSGAAILLVSNDDYPDRAERLEASGARGFLLKSQLAVADLATFWRRAGERRG
jgi:DNA-binding NarL/FixJ family response regulator